MKKKNNDMQKRVKGLVFLRLSYFERYYPNGSEGIQVAHIKAGHYWVWEEPGTKNLWVSRKLTDGKQVFDVVVYAKYKAHLQGGEKCFNGAMAGKVYPCGYIENYDDIGMDEVREKGYA